MGSQRGRNAGITNLVDLPRLGTGQKFNVYVTAYGEKLGLTEKPRAGRGTSGKWSKGRPILSSGSIVMRGTLTDGFPLPDQWKGQEGTLTVTVGTRQTQTVPIRITAAAFDHSEKDDDLIAVTLTATITNTPTWQGFEGTQAAATDPTRTDQEQWGGTSKSVDPQGLQSGATRLIDAWGALNDTDAAEEQKIADIIAAATVPMANMKLRSASFQRDSDDGGTIVLTYGLTDTGEDVTNPRTVTTLDTNHLGSVATAAAINATPATPAGDSFVLRTTDTMELNDGHLLKTCTFGLRDTKDDYEMPATVTGDDPYDLSDDATICKVTNSNVPPPIPTAPVGEVIEIRSTQINRLEWQHTFKYGNLNSKNALEFPASPIEFDPSGLQDADHQAQVTSSVNRPTVPTPRVTGLKLRECVSRRVSGTPEKWLHTFEWGRRTTQEDVEMPATVTLADGSNLKDNATVCKVTSSPTPPTPPTAPVGQLVSTETEQLHGSDTTKWKHTFRYANNTNQQDVEFAGTATTEDPQDLGDEDRQTLVNGSATPPTDPTPTPSTLKLRKRISQRIGGTPTKWKHTWEFGRRNTVEDIEMPGTITELDVSNLKDKGTATQVTTNSTPPTAPTAPVGQLVRTESEQLYSGRWRHTWTYSNNTAQQDVEFAGTATGEDPQDLGDEYRETIVNGSSTPPTDPTPTPASLKLRKRISQRIGGTPVKWKHSWEFGRRNTQEDIEMPGSITELDVSNLRDKGTATQVTTNSTPPTPPAAAVGQLVRTESEQLYSGRWRHTFTYSNNTAQQDVEFAGTATDEDPQDLEDSDLVTIVNGSSTPPSTPTPTPSTLKLRKRVSKRIGGTPTKWSHAFAFAVRTTKDDIQQLNTFTTTDPSDLTSDGKQAIVYDTAASTPTPSIPSGQQVVSTKFGVIHDGKKRVDFEFGKDTSQQKVEQARTKTVTDPNNLTSEGTTAALDATPASLGGVFVVRDTITEPVTHDHSVNVKRHGLRDTKDDEQMPATFTVTDPLGIETEGTKAEVYPTSGGVPTAATPPSGTQLVTSRILELNRLNSIRHSTFGVLNSEQKRTFPKTSTTDDAQNLEDEAVRGEFWTVGNTPPALPTSAPGNNVKLITFTDVPVTPTRNMRIWLYGPKNSRDKLVLPNTETTDDPNALQSVAIRGALDGETILDPAGYVLRKTRTIPVTTGLGINRTLTVKEYALRSTVDDVEMPGTFNLLDPFGIDSKGTFTKVYVTAVGAPTDPTPPTGLQIVASKIETLNQTKSAKVWQYDVTNSKQREEFGRTRVGTDPQSIEDRQLAASVFTTATPPTDPTPPTGLKLVDKTDIPLTPTQSVRVYDYQRNDSKDRIEFGGTIAVADPVNTFEQALATVSADATADLGAILTTQFNLYKADPSFDGLRIRRVNPSLVEIVRKINNGDKILRMSLRTERVLMRATPSVMVSQVIARANGKYALIVGQSMMRTTGRVTLHRRRNGTSPTDDTVLFLGALGRMNVSSFLGIPSNSLIYEGPAGLETNAGLTGGRLLSVDYGFSYDSNAFVDDSQVALGWVFTTGSPVVGLNSAGVFGWTVGNPAVADYSGFIA